MSKWLVAVGAGLLATACSGNTDNADTTADDVTAANTTTAAQADLVTEQAPASAQPTDAKGYIAMAGAGDMWEIESSKALLEKSTNADIKTFAQMMVEHHTASTEKVKAAAKSANIAITPPKLDAEQQKMLDEIKNANVGAIDAIYIRNQELAHGKALALHQGYAASGDTDALKKAAGEIAPVVQRHIDELRKLNIS